MRRRGKWRRTQITLRSGKSEGEEAAGGECARLVMVLGMVLVVVLVLVLAVGPLLVCRGRTGRIDSILRFVQL